MNWNFWKSSTAVQLPTPSSTLVSYWRVIWAKVFSHEYRGTRWMSIFTIVQYFIFSPVQPWVPDKSELHQLIGMPKFQHYLTSSQSGIHFSVSGVLLHCSFSGTGGLNGCDRYEDLIRKGKFVRAIYFWTSTNYGVGYRMLHTLEQDGRVIISADDAYRDRLISFQAGKETKVFLNLLFSSIVILLLFLERRRSKTA